VDYSQRSGTQLVQCRWLGHGTLHVVCGLQSAVWQTASTVQVAGSCNTAYTVWAIVSGLADSYYSAGGWVMALCMWCVDYSQRSGTQLVQCRWLGYGTLHVVCGLQSAVWQTVSTVQVAGSWHTACSLWATVSGLAHSTVQVAGSWHTACSLWATVSGLADS